MSVVFSVVLDMEIGNRQDAGFSFILNPAVGRGGVCGFGVQGKA
ncbi:MAG: hypothetical protein ABI167_04645 [Nitrosospira sp.]